MKRDKRKELESLICRLNEEVYIMNDMAMNFRRGMLDLTNLLLELNLFERKCDTNSGLWDVVRNQRKILFECDDEENKGGSYGF